MTVVLVKCAVDRLILQLGSAKAYNAQALGYEYAVGQLPHYACTCSTSGC